MRLCLLYSAADDLVLRTVTGLAAAAICAIIGANTLADRLPDGVDGKLTVHSPYTVSNRRLALHGVTAATDLSGRPPLDVAYWICFGRSVDGGGVLRLVLITGGALSAICRSCW